MDWNDVGAEASSSLSAYWNSAIGVNNGSAYETAKTSETVPMNAIQSMEPVTANVTTPSWDQFLQNTLSGVVGYAIKKDATANGVPAAATQAAPAATAPKSIVGQLVIVVGLVMVGAIVYKLAVK